MAHPNKTHGMTKTATYKSWMSAKSRWLVEDVLKKGDHRFSSVR
jgi:hypothetical protein